LTRAIEVAEMKAEVAPDIVEQVKTYVRSHPWTAWPTIIFLSVTLIIAAANNIIEFIEKIRTWLS